jgi:glutamate dehydrogenase
MTSQEMRAAFSHSLQEAADVVWERFCQTMPKRYFRETDTETQLAHLHVLTACQASGVDQDLVVRSHDGHTWTFLTGRSFPGQLGQMLDRLPEDRSLSSARAYTASDGSFVLDIFELGEREQQAMAESEFASHKRRLAEGLHEAHASEMETHLRGCSLEYLRAVPTRIAQIHFELVSQVQETGEVQVQWEKINDDLDTVRLTIEGTQAKIYFQRIARYLGAKGIDIERAYVTSFTRDDRSFRYLGFTLKGVKELPKEWLSEELKRLHYLDRSALELWAKTDDWELSHCEVADFLLVLAHSLLCHKDPVRFTRPRLVQAALRNPIQLLRMITAFWSQSPAPTDFTNVDREDDRHFFQACAQILKHLDCHNLEQTGRQATGARLRAELFPNPRPEQPYAVFFARGRGFEGFHVRFQDVARGGMRLVCPRSLEAHTAESERLYEEAYSLARAQHLKNKDIPEGGAKAAVLVQPGSDATFAGKAFANTLLDLTVGRAHDGNPELIYLGPDENVSNSLIVWITQRAALRGHPLPSAFMSSKPGAGINHKEFGITSEGVTVFLEESLHQLGIDPDKEPFTLKITGGPDGDVAGNEIRILLTRYRKTARILGIADGSGVAEDPQGLDPEELLRLFEEVQPIANFNPQRLSASGRVVSVESPGGVELRNTLHNRLVTDAFIPAGGRPATINADNWQEFLLNGHPSSRLIVEGANLFLTDEARQKLSDEGVYIVKDSSANKCGVICSSFEVLASMLLSEEEFLTHKTAFVRQVIERLRILARFEAELLFREHKRRPDLSLPTLSIRLSQVMLKTAEAVATASVDPLSEQHGGTLEVFQSYLPPLLRDLAGNRLHQVPLDYRQRIVACSLSSKIVYREGITYLEDLPNEAMRELALTYLRGESVVRELIDEVKESDLQSSEKLVQLLEYGGARTLAHNHWL